METEPVETEPVGTEPVEEPEPEAQEIAPLIRAKADDDAAAVLDLLMRVHATDGYPMHLTADEVPAFFVSDHEAAAWVAEQDGDIVGHVALHCPPEDPTVDVAQRATGLPVDRLALVARLFVAPELRRSGLGRVLLRHATAQAPALGRRAVLDVGQTLHSAVALYEAEGWQRAGELHLPLDPDTMLDLWVYVSPDPHQMTTAECRHHRPGPAGSAESETGQVRKGPLLV